jgi:hypothetical protein
MPPNIYIYIYIYISLLLIKNAVWAPGVAMPPPRLTSPSELSLSYWSRLTLPSRCPHTPSRCSPRVARPHPLASARRAATDATPSLCSSRRPIFGPSRRKGRALRTATSVHLRAAASRSQRRPDLGEEYAWSTSIPSTMEVEYLTTVPDNNADLMPFWR